MYSIVAILQMTSHVGRLDDISQVCFLSSPGAAEVVFVFVFVFVGLMPRKKHCEERNL